MICSFVPRHDADEDDGDASSGSSGSSSKDSALAAIGALIEADKRALLLAVARKHHLDADALLREFLPSTSSSSSAAAAAASPATGDAEYDTADDGNELQSSSRKPHAQASQTITHADGRFPGPPADADLSAVFDLDGHHTALELAEKFGGVLEFRNKAKKRILLVRDNASERTRLLRFRVLVVPAFHAVALFVHLHAMNRNFAG